MKGNYTKIQDYLDDDSFVQWVLSGRDDAYWRQFLADYPQHSAMVRQAQTLILDIKKNEGADLPFLDQRMVWAKISANLRDPEVSDQESASLKWGRYAIWQWVAGVAIMLGLSWYTWQNQPGGVITYQELSDSIREKNELVERINTQDAPLEIALEDGSVVILHKGSKLMYPRHFGDKNRNVILMGEAFFEVSRDSDRPFYIYANEVVTKVLGTSFRIRAFEKEQQVTVQVSTGRVSVYKQRRINLADPETDGLVLLPNQEAVINRKAEGLSRRLVDKPQPVLKREFDTLPTRYDEAPASLILRDIETRYGITILFNDDVLDHCYLTTTLKEESLYDQLDLICKTIGASYKEVDGQLVVESKGCRF
ncbi:FecR family protein [Persicitalea jodogahamensis]|uniref:Anti-sigma factor n=1 Tax=Persicitalea jodogahamensis TaxID=402147 RepID=A0A8J3D3J8_9BACT|nr:FecR family protein [Persicitalea jodogahamensis]GHB52649.1 anti-sigma factor [Persicitalea jodogahamensis]